MVDPKNRRVQRSARPQSPPSKMVTRIVASEDRLAEAGSEVLPQVWGRVIRQSAYPHVFDANVIRHPDLDGADLDLAIARLGSPLRTIGARHIQISCDGWPLSDAVKAGLRTRGFLCDRLLAMVLPGPLARPIEASVEVCRVPDDAPFSDYAEAMDRMSREEPWYSPAVSHEIIGSLRSKSLAGVVELHVARLDGRVAGAAGLSIGQGPSAGVASVLTVGTVPEARNRKVAQSVVGLLAQKGRAAGCDLIYLLARADDSPKDMYRKFGFEVAFGFDVWLRPPL